MTLIYISIGSLLTGRPVHHPALPVNPYVNKPLFSFFVLRLLLELRNL